MPDNLDKEHFFDRMNELYPDASEHFAHWLDGYKKEVEWDRLFNDNCVSAYDLHTLPDEPVRMPRKMHAPGFHQMPFEMQAGIIARYRLEQGGAGADYENIAMIFRKEFESCLAMLQRETEAARAGNKQPN